jgi:hypothetical protein
MMSKILGYYLHKFVTVYLDDARIYRRTQEEQRLVLQPFKEEGMKLRVKKCLFGV